MGGTGADWRRRSIGGSRSWESPRNDHLEDSAPDCDAQAGAYDRGIKLKMNERVGQPDELKERVQKGFRIESWIE